MNRLLASVLGGLSLLGAGAAHGQAKPPDYKFTAAIRADLARDTLPWRYQEAANYYARVGAYADMLAVWDVPGGRPRLRPVPDSAQLAALKPVDARRYLLERARHERIIIINEAHQQPRHRAFVASLLPELAALGFRYLAVEAVDRGDSLLNRRGYPVLASGYYTKEPQFGELLRTALRQHYRVAGYDVAGNGKEREQGQARAIQRLLTADPTAKIVVYCGFDHVVEGAMPAETHWEKAMAGWLKEWTGIDPLTVDQVQLTESSAPGFGNGRFRVLPPTPNAAVWLDAQGAAYNQARPRNDVDLNVSHPATTYRAGRPAWLFERGARPLAVSPAVTVPFPCLVFAYHAGEDPLTAVAADIIELQTPQDATCLALPKGDYSVVVRSQSGAEQTLLVRGGALTRPAAGRKGRPR